MEIPEPGGAPYGLPSIISWSLALAASAVGRATAAMPVAAIPKALSISRRSMVCSSLSWKRKTEGMFRYPLEKSAKIGRYRDI